MTEFDSVPMLRRPLGIGLTVVLSFFLIVLVAFFASRFYGWAEEQTSTFIWFGRYESEADILAAAQPRTAIAAILQDISSRLPVTKVPPRCPSSHRSSTGRPRWRPIPTYLLCPKSRTSLIPSEPA
jgi:hypothetical protein